MKPAAAPLLPLLKQYFGFTTFRPHQEEIIRASLAGQDTFALLPTGGGKSLCFQLPALTRDGLTVVVSPLIALMKDQVDALQAAGVPATFLNSSLAAGESRERLRGLHQGEFKLLYVAPERLLLSGFLDDLKRWRVALFAIDEAHCISEWGHDFRPEYRQLASGCASRFPTCRSWRSRPRPRSACARTSSRSCSCAIRGAVRRELQPAQPHLSRQPKNGCL